MDSNLIQLVSRDCNIDKFLNHGYYRSSEIKEYTFEDNKIYIERTCDTIIPLYIISDKPIDYLELFINDKLIISFPLDFCNKLSNKKIITESEYLYTIPWEILKFKPLIILGGTMGSSYQYRDFRIVSSNNCNAKMYIKNTFMDSDERKNLATKPHMIRIKQFQEQQIQVPKNFTESIPINFEGLIKGFFIDNINNIESINNIEFIFNTHCPRLNYNKTMIKLFTHQISENCIYIPLDNTIFNDSTYDSALNCDKIRNQFMIKINSEVNQDIVIRSLVLNVLMFIGGLARVRIDYNFKNSRHHIKFINQKID